jgi:hypothetical protein
MSKRKAYSKVFQEALNYLIDQGFNTRQIANALTKIGLPVQHTAVHYWHKEKRLPQSQAIINAVIALAEHRRRRDCLIRDLHAKIDELSSDLTLGAAVEHYRKHGYKSNEKLNDKLAELANKDPRTIASWRSGPTRKSTKIMGIKSNTDKLKDAAKYYGARVNEDEFYDGVQGILGEIAEQRGLPEKIHYEMYLVCEPYFDMLPITREEIKAWRDWCAEHEKKKQGLSVA